MKRNRKLNDQQLRFIKEHFVNGFSPTDAALKAGYGNGDRKSASRMGNYLAGSANILSHVNHAVSTSMRKSQTEKRTGELLKSESLKAVEINSFEWKVNKLLKTIDLNLPDPDVTRETYNKNDYNFPAGLAAMAELNKMQGHHAPAKSVHVDVKTDADMQEIIALSKQYLIEYNSNTNDKY